VSIDFVARKPDGKPEDRTPVEPGEEFQGAKQSDFQTLLTQTSDLVPTTQQALNDMRTSMKRYERMAPQIEETAKEIANLSKALREMSPDFRRTNDELRITAINWGRVGERMDVLLQANQDKLVK